MQAGVDTPKRKYTVDEFLEFISQSENSDRRFELIDGDIIEKIPTERLSIISGNLLIPLHSYAKTYNLGRVVSNVMYCVPHDDYNVRLPNVTFTSKARLLPVVEEGAVPLIPDLCVEVVSKDDHADTIKEKVVYFLSNGATLVWLVYLKMRRVEIYQREGVVIVLSENDMLNGGAVIPGFTLPVHDIFNEGI